MNYLIRVTAAASRDLDAAFDYIDLTLKNPAAADHLVELFYQKSSSLENFPERFPLVQDSLLSSLGIRFQPVQNFLAFYRIEESSHTVYILRFLYGRSDWSAVLKSDILRS